MPGSGHWGAAHVLAINIYVMDYDNPALAKLGALFNFHSSQVPVLPVKVFECLVIRSGYEGVGKDF